jgi:hypothetical protein
MADTQRSYRAFLLRLWQECSEGQWVWRASLEGPHSHARKGFPDLEQLCDYLRQQTDDETVEES